MTTALPQQALFLIDGSYLLYRSYFGLPVLHGPSGNTVHATFSFCRTLNKLIKTYNPSHLCIAWDSPGGSTTRKETYEAYKATRQAPPSDLIEQKNDIIRFIETIKVKNVIKPGFEADDLINTIVQNNPDKKIVIVSADKDLCQLLSEHVVIFDPFKDKVITLGSFETDYGFPSAKISFYHALLGDSSDNIPGVKGIGDKTASGLVAQFTSLDDLYKNIDQVVKDRTRTLLANQQDNAFLSLKLFSLMYTELPFSFDDFIFTATNWLLAAPFFQEFSFSSLLKEIQKIAPSVPLPQASSEATMNWKLHTVTSEQALEEMIKHLSQTSLIGVDTETTGVLPLLHDLVGLSFAYNTTEAYYLPVGHKNSEQEPQLTKEYVLEKLTPILTNERIHKTLHNAKFDELVLYNNGISCQGIVFDTLIAAGLVRKDDRPINLKALSQQYLNESMIKFREVMGKKYDDFSDVPIAAGAAYGAHDALQALKLAQLLQEELEKEPTLKKLFYDIEMPLYHVLTAIEKRGILVNEKKLHALEKLLTEEIATVESKIFGLIESIDGTQEPTLNLQSPKQVEELLFVKLKLPPMRKNKSGSRSTDQEVLEALSLLHPIPGLIIKHRELSKLLSTYVQPLPREINPKTGRIHTTFSQTNVATGRLSSSNPNLQNIPSSGTFGLGIREAFEAPEGSFLLSADYSQIELRILANMSNDQHLQAIFKSGKDIHQQTAAQLFSVPVEQVSPEQRQIGKRINFSIMYGMTPFSLAKEFNLTPSEAKLYIDRYFEQYPQIDTWMKDTVTKAEKTGYVETMWGRRRYIPEILEKNRTKHEAGVRAAINTPIQGTQADVIKIAMIRLDHLFSKQKLQSKLIHQIHDELLFEVPEHEIFTVQSLVQTTMEQIVSWNIPLKVSLRLGKNWAEITK